MENFNTTAYIIYLLIVIGLTITVSQVLFKNSLEFMKSIFRDRDHLAIATNKLFQIGFFLLALGLGLWYMTIYREIDTPRFLLEELSTRIGFFTLFLGALVFFNMYLFFRGMKVAKQKAVNNENA